jgi:hypothetical protein
MRGTAFPHSRRAPFEHWRCAIVFGIVVGDERPQLLCCGPSKFNLELKGAGCYCRTVSY